MVVRIVFGSLVFVAAACAGTSEVGSPDIEGFLLGDDPVMRAVSSSADTAAVVLVEPGHCFTCGGDISLWRGWARNSESREIGVILLSEPSEAQREELVRQRVLVSGVITNEWNLPSPVVAIYINGVLGDWASGQAGVAGLRSRWVH